MARTSRIQQIYGYMVCLVAIITLLISSATLVGAIFDITRPATIEAWGEGESFEQYRLTQLERATSVREKTNAAVTIPSDSALRASYNEMKQRRADWARWNATKSIVTSILLIGLAITLFTIHWRWLRNASPEDTW